MSGESEWDGEGGGGGGSRGAPVQCQEAAVASSALQSTLLLRHASASSQCRQSDQSAPTPCLLSSAERRLQYLQHLQHLWSRRNVR